MGAECERHKKNINVGIQFLGLLRRTFIMRHPVQLYSYRRRILAAFPLPPAIRLVFLGATIVLSDPAFAAGEPAASGHSEALFLAEIVLLLLFGRLCGEIMQRLGQPAVMGQLLAGIILGPSVFGTIWPQAQQAIFPDVREQKAMVEAVSDLGILMLLLLTGMETDLKLVKRLRRAAISVSAAGIVVPFICGFALGQVLPEAMLPRPDQRLVTSMFLGTALSVASVKIVATVVREMNFLRRKVGMTLIASAIIDDTVGWTIDRKSTRLNSSH